MFGIFVLNIYRAATQSITIDEAFTWSSFASQPMAGLFAPYNVNNHVLNSLLIRLSVTLFGLSEFALRLPSVLAGGLYLASTWRIAALLFGRGPWALATAALLSLDPLLLDHLSAARGYGESLAFWLAAVCCLVRALDDSEEHHLFSAGILCGLAMAASPTALFPVVATAVAWIVINRSRISPRESVFSFETISNQFAVPAILIPCLLMAIPLSRASAGMFYFGARSLTDTVQSLTDASFGWGLASLSPVLGRLIGAIHNTAWPAVVGVFGITAALTIWKLKGSDSESTDELRIDRNLGFFGLILISVVVVLYVAHWGAGLLYPLSRTGLYFIPILVLSTSTICYRYRTVRVVSYAASLTSALCLLIFILQLRISQYAEWPADAGTKTISTYIGAHYSSTAPLTIRASWELESALNFYRLRDRLNWKEITRDPLDEPGDVWVVMPTDSSAIEKLHLHPVYRDKLSGVVVADRAPAPGQ